MGSSKRAGLRCGAVLVALGMALTACGDDDADEGAAPGTTATTVAPDEPTTSAPSASSTDDAATTEPADETTTAAGSDETPVEGGTLRLNAPAPSNIVPYGVFGPIATTGSRERFALYDALAVLDPEGEVQYRIAESIESSDSTAWTVHLREGVTFSDGTPFDATAVQYNWTKMADPASAASQTAIAATISTMTVTNDLTLEVTLAAPNAQFPRLVATSALAFVGSPTAMEAFGDGFNTSPVGAGAFVLEEWVDGSFMRLARNPDYYGDGPYLDGVEFQYIEDPTGAAQYSTFQAGDIDVLSGAVPETLAQAADAGYEIIESQTSGGAAFQMNVTKPPFDDLRARQAVALAFDFDEMNVSAFGGLAEPASTLFTESSPFYEDIPLLPEPDSEQAQALFDELAAEGKPVEFTILMFADLDRFDDWLIARLSSFDNVSVTSEVVGRPAAIEAYRGGNFQATLRPVQFIAPEPLVTDNFSSTGAQNYGKYSNPDVDAALLEARTVTDDEERAQSYAAVQRALAADIPSFFYRRISNATVVQSADAFGDLPLLSDGLIDFSKAWKR